MAWVEIFSGIRWLSKFQKVISNLTTTFTVFNISDYIYKDANHYKESNSKLSMMLSKYD